MKNSSFAKLIPLFVIFATGCKEIPIEISPCDLNVQNDGEKIQEEINSVRKTIVTNTNNNDDTYESGDDDILNNEANRDCEVPVAAPEGNLNIAPKLTNFNEEQTEKMIESLKRLKVVINSEEFRTRIIEHTFKEEYTFVDNGGYTNEDIYNILMTGEEILIPGADQEMDIDVTMYYKNNSTVGYTYKNTVRTWVNAKFFYRHSFGDVAANVTHEWTHKLGFDHDYKNNSERPYSVPYAVGKIMAELVDNM